MPKTDDPYAALADLYDSLAGDPELQSFYRLWRETLLREIEKRKIRVSTLVDLACGTGNTAVPWTTQPGWKIVGVDASAAMLRQARKKSKSVRWYCQDLKNLDLIELADAVTCHFDALNHILNSEDMQTVFVNVSGILNAGGLFQFDMNTDAWMRWLSAHEKMFRIGPNYMMAQNEYDPARHIATFHQFWFVKKGKAFEKREIAVRERAYSTRIIQRMLKRAGLCLLKAHVQCRLEGKPIRILYLARKQS